MEKRVKFFTENSQPELQKTINEFARIAKIDSVSYSVYVSGYSTRHAACVVYFD